VCVVKPQSRVSMAIASAEWSHGAMAMAIANPPLRVKQRIMLRRQIRAFSIWSFGPTLGHTPLIIAGPASSLARRAKVRGIEPTKNKRQSLNYASGMHS
jgi:hypothetical protein